MPHVVVDVGAAAGTNALYETWPGARHLALEPLSENWGILRSLALRYPGLELVEAAAGSQEGTSLINVHPDLDGSSVFLESEDSDVNGQPREIRTTTVDKVIAERNLVGPFLLKIDVQGAELDVLRGAAKALEQTELVIVEIVFFDFFRGGPTFFDIVSHLDAMGFVPYDVFDLGYRLLDGAMSQVDMAFVRRDGPFRKSHVYASREQRAQQTRHLLEARTSQPGAAAEVVPK